MISKVKSTTSKIIHLSAILLSCITTLTLYGCSQSVKPPTQNIQPLFDEAAALTKQQRLIDAALVLDKVVQLAPNDAAAHAAHAEALAGAGRVPEVVPAFKRAVALDPNNESYKTRMAIAAANCAQTEEQYKEATHLLEVLAEQHSVATEMAISLGNLHARFAQWQPARSSLEIAVSGSPFNPDVWYALSVVCLRLADHAATQMALQQYEEITAARQAAVDIGRETLMRPGDAQTHFRYGKALLRAGAKKGAAKQFGIAAQLAPDNQNIRQAYVETMQAIGSPSQHSEEQHENTP